MDDEVLARGEEGMSDIVERLRYRRDYLLPSDLMAEAADEIARLRSELAKAREENDALDAKVQALAPHGTCGCSYDAPDDVCDHHSPQLAKTREVFLWMRDVDPQLVDAAIEKFGLAKAKKICPDCKGWGEYTDWGGVCPLCGGKGEL